MNDLKAFLDGELDATAAAAFGDRLASDGALAAAAGDFRMLGASFAALTVGPAVTGRERVLVAVRSPRRTVFPWKFAGAMASLVFVVAVVSNLQRGGGFVAAGVESDRVGSSAASGGAPMRSEQAPSASMPLAEEGAGAPSTDSSVKARTNENLFRRQVVRTGALTIRGASVEAAEAKVTEYVDGVKGYIEDTSSNNLNGKTPSMTMVVRVPQAQFTEALVTFEKLGTRLSKDTQATDVTQQVVDVDARLKNLRSQEETYRAILRSANKVGEIVDVQERLSRIRGDIESMQAQRDSLGKLAALATINLRLQQRPPVEQATGGWVEDTWSRATGAFGEALRSLSVLGIWILVYSPIWLPLAFFSLWGWRRAVRA